jgi:restriction system protein
MARPFALIGEAERRLRRQVDETLDIDLIRTVNKKASSAADLTLGAYEHLLVEPNFRLLGWLLDWSTFLAQLSRVRRIRNELMHFSPDPPTEAELNDLDGFVSMLRTVDPRP